MSKGTEKAIGVTGIILTLIGFNISFEGGEEVTQQHTAIHQAVEETKAVVSNISDVLGRFEVTLGGAKAHAFEAPGYMDYSEYLITQQAKSDLHDIERYFDNSENEKKSELLKVLTDQLRAVESDYKKELRSINTVGREIKRTEGLLLSHRRQLGVIVTAIKMVAPPSSIYALATDVEVMLSETS